MSKYKVHFTGWYIIEAESSEDAIATDYDDYDVEYLECANKLAEEVIEWEQITNV